MPEGTKKEKGSIWLYLLIANIFTWVLWIPSLLIANINNFSLPTINNYTMLMREGFTSNFHLVLSIFFSLAVYGPFLAAFIVVRMQKGKNGFSHYLATVFKWKIRARWYLIAFALALCIALLPFMIGILSRTLNLSINHFTTGLTLFIPIFLIQVLTSGLGEEPGWRGFLLPALRKIHNKDTAVWLVGIAWAVWHFPFTIFEVLSNTSNLGTPALIVTILSSLAGQTISLIGMSFIYTWLVTSAKSTFLAIIFHALTNTLPAVLIGQIPPSLSFIVGFSPWVMVFFLQRILGKENFPFGSKNNN